MAIEEWVMSFIRILQMTVLSLLRAGKDKTLQEEALMTLQEETKRELDRRRFGDTPNPDLADTGEGEKT